MTLADEDTVAGADGGSFITDVLDMRVEWLGRVRLAPFGEKVPMEFVSGVVVLRRVFVDLGTQAVYANPDSMSVDLGWLYPRGARWSGNPAPVDFVQRAALVPTGRAADPLGLLLEFCASIHVLDRAGWLDGRSLLGRAPAEAESLVGEACERYGADLFTCGTEDGLVYADELVVPQFWVQQAGTEPRGAHVPRWAIGGYSVEFLADLRQRFGVDETIERPLVAGPVGYQARYGRDVRRDRNLGEVLEDCERVRAVLVPPSDRLGLHARAAFYSALAHLVAVYGEDDANVVFMTKGARLDEMFVAEYAFGPFCLLADLLELEYVPTILPLDPETAGPPPFTRSPLVTGEVRRHLLGSAIGNGGIRPLRRSPVWIVTTINDDEELLSDWLDYYRAIGASRVVAFASTATAGVRTLVASDRFAGFVDLRDEAGGSPKERLALTERIADQERSACGERPEEETERVFLLPLEVGDFLLASSPTGLEWKELTAAMMCADEIEFSVHRVVGLRSVAEHNAGRERLATATTYRFTEPAGRVVMTVTHAADEGLEPAVDSAAESETDAEREDLGPVRVALAGLGVLRIECDPNDRSRAFIEEAERDAGLSSGRLAFDSSLAHAVVLAKSVREMTGFDR